MATSTIEEKLAEALRKQEPATLRANLTRAGLFLAGWELLKTDIIETVHDYFLVDAYFENGVFHRMDSPDYVNTVLPLHGSPLEASLRWLVQNGGLDEEYAVLVHDLRQFRNEVAHQLPRFLRESGKDITAERLLQLRLVMHVLSRWPGKLKDPDDPNGPLKSSRYIMDRLIDAADVD
jgi:hypothetical protein